jgi:hypothetical protein
MDPNPATEQVTVNWMNHRLEAVSIRLLDMSGVCVYSKKTGNQQNGAQYINIDKLASGIYLMELTAGNEKVVLRLVKK